MSKLDQIYQEAVNSEANKLLELTPEQFILVGDYGNLKSKTPDKTIDISWWHYQLDENLHHIVFITGRPVFLFLYKKYLAGAKLKNGQISILSYQELADYD